MGEKQSKVSMAAIIVIVCVVVAATIGGLYAWDQINKDKQITESNAAAKKAAAEAEKEEEEEEKEQAAPNGSYDGWLAYEDTAKGFSMKYPADWTYEKNTETQAGAAADYITFYNDDKDYAFSFGMRKAGVSTIVTRGTTLANGVAESGGTVAIAGQDIEKTYYVENGRVSIIFYGPGLGTYFNIGGNEIAAELRVPGYDDKTLKGNPKETITDMILSSLVIK